jgi:hypothetical protein
MGTYKIGGAPLAYRPRVLLLGRSLKIHKEIKRELFMISL